MKRILRGAMTKLSSLKLTVAVLALLILVSIPATLIPQNQGTEFYTSRYPGTLGYFILAFGYHRFFSSPAFLILLGIFWVNLFSCTLKRFTRQIRSKRKGRYGPDILHLGLLILIIASAFSFITRQEGYVFMKAGDSMQLPSGRYMNLEEFIYQQYPDGRPKSWISRVTISESPHAGGEEFAIAVNHPLRIDGLVLYQSGYRPGETPGEYETGLAVVSDPGKISILLSLLLICGGLTLTFIQGRRDP